MKITEKIHLLKIDFEINFSSDKKLLRFVNVIIIFGDKITLIDTGVKGSENYIFEYIKENNRSISEIDTIILSHSHPDHIGSAAIIKEKTGCKILAHKNERNWIEDIKIQNKERPVPGFFTLVDQPVKIDEFVTDLQEMRPNNDITMKIFHSPGHSKGSINILFKEDKILFTADSIPLKNDIPNYDNYLSLIKSLNFIKNNQEYETLLTSWTPPLTDKEEINKLLTEGEEYLLFIDEAVKEFYSEKETASLDSCKNVVTKLGMPPIFINPIVDKAFRSHL